jgi:hypothetical protein
MIEQKPRRGLTINRFRIQYDLNRRAVVPRYRSTTLCLYLLGEYYIYWGLSTPRIRGKFKNAGADACPSEALAKEDVRPVNKKGRLESRPYIFENDHL